VTCRTRQPRNDDRSDGSFAFADPRGSLRQDHSWDVYFGPEAPEGQENNWIQTIPGKGLNVILRLYGPLEPWYDKTWRPGEIELVK